MIVNCKNCNSELERTAYEIKRSTNFFCNKDCRYSSQRAKVKCGYCNIYFTVEKHKQKMLQEGKVQNLFCCKNHLQKWQADNFKVIPKTKFCLNCIAPYLSKNKDSKFCSQQCLFESRTKNIEIDCDTCGENFSKKPSMIRANNFCSKKCSWMWNSMKKEQRPIKICPICDESFACFPSQEKYRLCCSYACVNRYKATLYLEQDGVRDRLRQQGLKSSMALKGKETKPEKIVREWLESKSINFIDQHLMYDKFVVDFFIPNENIVVEVLGDYWHGNPLEYGDDLIPLTPKQKRQQGKDHSRYSYLNACGHKVLMIWEKDIYKDIDKEMSKMY